MLVIVEGADGSGKTTLVETLRTKGYNILDIHCKANIDTAWKAFAESPTIFICDRSFLTDVIYRLLDNKEPATTLEGQLEIIKGGLKIILCDTDTHYEDSMVRGEDNITDRNKACAIRDTYWLICRFYNKFAGVPVLQYNWQIHKLQAVTEFIGNPGSKQPVDIQNNKKEE